MKTERLNLRNIGPQDIDVLFYLRSDPMVNRYIQRIRARSREDVNKFVNNLQQETRQGQSVYWCITTNESGKMIGSICLWDISADGSVAELGYELHPHFHHRGIMSEAMNAVLEYGFCTMELDKIEAFTHRENNPSIKVLLSHKFLQLKDRVDPKYPENIVFGLTRLHWEETKNIIPRKPEDVH